MSKQSIEARAEELIQPILDANSFEFVDMEYVKEGSDWYLRAYIDKDGGITVDDCELVSRAFELKLDEEDLIKDAYILEVSSPGLTRPLKKERDYIRNEGKPVEVHLYKAVEKSKQFTGNLKSWNADTVTLDIDGTDMIFEKKNISLIRQTFEW